MNSAGFLTCILSVFGIALQAWVAHAGSFLTVSEMKRRGFERGLPFIAHGGMWGDLFIITPLLGIIASKYAASWSDRSIVLAAVVCFSVSIFATIMWSKSPFPEAHTRTGAWFIHMIYAGAAFAAIALFYFATPHQMIEPKFAIAASTLITIHIFFGTHTALKIWNPEWFGTPFRFADLVPTAIVAVLLGWRTYAIISSR